MESDPKEKDKSIIYSEDDAVKELEEKKEKIPGFCWKYSINS